ncbi:carboxy-terminal protease for penicillin-binding protein 3 [Lentisphaera araneosa HTCC2155]|uniref:Carboxy-terminal protease for penicillin-binding protein 3 n=1 Tax=Lentisphaera araneosa HTCC2155 TaxID=313628 RepID=A6DF34_9BACT|nr:carboxy terminal-processing peptidase [Lentisphaera araneosa]EDM29414.1 carboxy-terminal protease for penicillin-binding protein 3 [Lentisphaera araneosa HTCC2155]
MNLKHLSALLLFFTSFSTFAEEDFIASEKERQVTRVVAQLMTHLHYEKKPLDDEMSKAVFDEFFKRLDYSKRIFLKSDYDQFSKYRPFLDDMYLQGDLTFAELFFKRFKQRVQERLDYAEKRLAAGMDLKHGGALSLDRENAEWKESPEELNDLWDRYIENEIINMHIGNLAKQMKKDDDEKKTEEEEAALNEDNGSTEEQVRRRIVFRLKNLLEMERDKFFEMAISMMTGCFDPHSTYFGPKSMEEFEIMMKLSLNGIGATLTNSDGYTKVVRIISGGPADKAKQLKKGDRIIEVQQAGEEPVNVIDMPLSKTISMIRGPKGKVVTLHVLRGGINGVRHVLSIKRDKIDISESAAARSKLFELERDGAMQKVGVIYLPSFYFHPQSKKSCANDVKAEVLKLKEQGMQSLVFDLRDNGGGSLSEVIKMTGFFIKEGPVVQVKDYRGEIDVQKDRSDDVVYGGPLTVLVNQHSASASEIFAAAIQDYERGVVIGSADRTHGKGTVQQVYDLERIQQMKELAKNGFKPGELKFTIAKFYRINGGSTQKMGVIPDIILPHFYDKENGGEASLRHSLKYDTIPRARVNKEVSVNSALDKLRNNSDKRVGKSDDFAELQKELDYYRDRYEDKEISLNQDERISEFKMHYQRSQDRKEVLRRISGRKPKAEEEEDDEVEGLGAFSQDGREEVLLDVYLKEAVEISIDLQIMAQDKNSNLVIR